MTSKIKHLQFVKLYLSTHVTNTKSMTPNQLRLRHRVSKAFAIHPSDRVRVSRQGFTTLFFFLFFFFFFSFFFLLFLFFSFLEDYIGLQIWVTQTYPRLPTYLRPALQSERRYTNSQLIETIWSAVCELA